MIWTWLHRRPLLARRRRSWSSSGSRPSVAATAHAHPFGGVLLVTVQTLPLLLRRRRPVLTVVIVTAASVAMIGLGIWLLPLQFAIALYTLAATRAPRRARSVGPASIAVVALALTFTGHYTEFGDSAARVVFLIAAWLLGDSIGSRQAYVREIEEKAERLERERETDARRIVAEEQARIARELHDVIAHALSVIVVQAGAAAGGLRDRAEERREADPSDRHGRAGSARRPAPRPRHPAGRRERGYAAATGTGATRQPRRPGSRDGTRCGAGDRGRGPAAAGAGRPLRLPDHPGGAHEHDQARERRARTRQRALRRTISCSRSGTTATARTASDAGHGLTGMRQRVAMLGGSVETTSPTTGGYLVTAHIPLAEEPR